MSDERKSRISKAIKTIIGATLLTVAYDYIFSPLFNRIINSFADISESFSNILYSAVAEGYYSDDSYLTFKLILYILFIASIYYCFNIFMDLFKPHKATKLDKQLKQQVNDLKHSEENYDIEKSAKILNEMTSQISRIKKSLMIFSIIALVLIFVLFSVITSMTSFVHNKKVDALTKIEIISPYVPDIEYKLLKSEFHLIKCKEDYNSLMDKISTVYDEHIK